MRNLNHEYVIHLVAEFDNKDAAIFEFCGGGDLRNDYISSLVVQILTSKVQNSIFWDQSVIIKALISTSSADWIYIPSKASLMVSQNCTLRCVFPMIAVSILPHAEFGRNDQREDAPLFIFEFIWAFQM